MCVCAHACVHVCCVCMHVCAHMHSCFLISLSFNVLLLDIPVVEKRIENLKGFIFSNFTDL